MATGGCVNVDEGASTASLNESTLKKKKKKTHLYVGTRSVDVGGRSIGMVAAAVVVMFTAVAGIAIVMWFDNLFFFRH
jgi:hypothetical protein